jgi:hypothetical protein
MGLTIARTTHLSYEEAMGKLHQLRDRDTVKKQVKADYRAAVSRDLPAETARRKADEFDQLIDHWKELGGRRDDVGHCFWSVSKLDGAIAGTRKGKLLTTDGAMPYSIADLKELIADLQQFIIHLNRMTAPELVRGPETDLNRIPSRFKPGSYRTSPAIVVETTAAATFSVEYGLEQLASANVRKK